MDVWSTVLTVVLSALGAGGLAATGTKFWLERNKQEDAQKIAEEVQATKTLEAEIARQGLRIDKLESANADCMKGHVEEARKSSFNEGQIAQLSKTVESQSLLIAQQNTTIADLKAALESYTKKVA